MSNNKMLIDASHPEETRVVVLRGNRIEEFDFEAANKKPLRGNIYLAKVTRVEPSLQAAFVEYGGNRHGFLAFSEIHPDYYQIPVADRLALLEDEAREQREEADEEDKRSSRRNNNNRRRRGGRQARRSSKSDEKIFADVPQNEDAPGEADSAAPDAIAAQDHSIVPENGDQPAEIVALDQNDAATDTSGQGSTEEDTSAASDSTSGQDESVVSTGTQEQSAPIESVNDAAEDAAQTPLPSAADNHEEASESKPNPDSQDSVAQPVAEAQDANESSEISGASVVSDDTQADVDGEPLEAREISPGQDEDAADDNDDDTSDDSEGDDSEGGDDDGDDGDDDNSDEDVEQLGGDSEEDVQRAPRRSRKQYKIQEVIKRRQIMLIQVVKEERGNKGAALTTYLSLAGRYSVLMPNTARGGGISRKITDGEDRRRMKDIAQGLDVPEGMGVILRTAGASRNNQEIRRDFEYLLRLWESVREMTLHSSAPTLVYEEGSLIKRSIRDLYGKEVDEVVVSGDEGYKEAKDFMRMLMPSHARHVKQWRESQPVYAKSGVEPQLDSLFSPNVTMKSGGYIVINQTEALVAIDVNSGRSTREHNIEDTALRTNMEAADEIARQLRLRDLAGLIVVDFIDMEEHRNNRSVERRMKDALKNDRARIQVGRISHFGLLEMSRQRMRTGVLEGSSIICPHCQGSGNVRSTASIALHVLRLTEEALLRNNSFDLAIKTRSEVALYILNQKRATLMELEKRFGVALTIEADGAMTGTTYHSIERGEPAIAPVPAAQQALQFISPADDEEELDAQADIEAQAIADADAQSEEESPRPARSRGGARRNQRGRSRNRIQDGDGDQDENAETSTAQASEDGDAKSINASSVEADTEAGSDGDDDGTQKRKRRRRRRGRGDRDASGISAEAPQPSDDGLGYIADANAPGTAPNAENGGNAEAADSAAEKTDTVDGSTEEETAPRRRGRRGGFRERKRVRAKSGDAEGQSVETETSGVDGGSEEAPSPRNGTWVKSQDDEGSQADAPAQTYPFASPAAGAPQVSPAASASAESAQPVEPTPAPEPIAPVQDVVQADTSIEAAAEDVLETAVAETRAAGTPADNPVGDVPNAAPADDISIGNEHSATTGANGSSSASEPDIESPAPAAPKEVEILPEAPPPSVKRTGWWKR